MTRRFAVQAFILGSLLAGCATTETPAPPAPQEPVGRAREPIQMNSPSLDPVTFDYLVRVRQMIRGRLTHPPCGNEWWVPWGCTYRSTRVVVQLSILKDGQLHSVSVVEPSEHAAYNESAVTAVRAAAPFPPIPQEVLGERTRLALRLPVEYQQPRRP